MCKPKMSNDGKKSFFLFNSSFDDLCSLGKKRKMMENTYKDVCVCQAKSINDEILFVFLHLSVREALNFFPTQRASHFWVSPIPQKLTELGNTSIRDEFHACL